MGGRALTFSALAAGVLTLGGGCLTAESKKAQPQMPDVTRPGVLPPPGAATKQQPLGASGVVQAGGVPPAANTPHAPAPAETAPVGASPLAKFAEKFEKKVPATEMEVAWRNRIAYLPDPSRNGSMGPGIVGQMFLFGGPKLEPAEPDGVLTVDLIDKTPRAAGQPAAKPERWQFSKEMLKNLRATDETFGRSFVLFLPWPAYRPDVTRVEISARYDPEHGFTLYSRPTIVTIDTSAPFGTPVWDGVTNSVPLVPGMKVPQPFGGKPPTVPERPKPDAGLPGSHGAIPIGGSQPNPATPNPYVQPIPLSSGNTPIGVPPSHGVPGAVAPIGGPQAPAPLGGPLAPAAPPGTSSPGAAALPAVSPPVASPPVVPTPLAPVAPAAAPVAPAAAPQVPPAPPTVSVSPEPAAPVKPRPLTITPDGVRVGGKRAGASDDAMPLAPVAPTR